MKFKSGRGGARTGAGRPKGTGKPIVNPRYRREQIYIRLPQFMIDWLKSQDQTPTEIIEGLLRQKMED